MDYFFLPKTSFELRRSHCSRHLPQKSHAWLPQHFRASKDQWHSRPHAKNRNLSVLSRASIPSIFFLPPHFFVSHLFHVARRFQESVHGHISVSSGKTSGQWFTLHPTLGVSILTLPQSRIWHETMDQNPEARYLTHCADIDAWFFPRSKRINCTLNIPGSETRVFYFFPPLQKKKKKKITTAQSISLCTQKVPGTRMCAHAPPDQYQNTDPGWIITIIDLHAITARTHPTDFHAGIFWLKIRSLSKNNAKIRMSCCSNSSAFWERQLWAVFFFFCHQVGMQTELHTRTVTINVVTLPESKVSRELCPLLQWQEKTPRIPKLVLFSRLRSRRGQLGRTKGSILGPHLEYQRIYIGPAMSASFFESAGIYSCLLLKQRGHHCGWRTVQLWRERVWGAGQKGRENLEIFQDLTTTGFFWHQPRDNTYNISACHHTSFQAALTKWKKHPPSITKLSSNHSGLPCLPFESENLNEIFWRFIFWWR